MPQFKELRVRESLQSDVGKGVARVSKATLKLLGAVEGDVVELAGPESKRALAVLLAEAKGGDAASIRLDGVLRTNTGVSIDETIKVGAVEVKDAREVLLAPRQALRYRKDFVSFVHEKILERPLLSGNRLLIDAMGTNLFFTVVKTKPVGAVRISPSTKLSISNKPMKAVSESGVHYEDIGGLSEEIDSVREMVEVPMRHPEVFKRLGISPPKGVLLQGPPGCGKTLLARAVATESEAHFITLNGPELMSKYYGESEQNLRKIFDEAKENAPTVVFMDEIDAIAPKRDDVGGEVERRVVSQLLTLMDGLEARGDIIVIAATNRPNSIDPALRRPGRFDREVAIRVPGKVGRSEIMQIHTRGMPLAEDVSLEELVGLTSGFTGADVSALCKEAAMHALRGILPQIKSGKNAGLSDKVMSQLTVCRRDFLNALKRIEPSGMREVRVEVPKTSWEEVGGLHSVKQELLEAVEWPMKHPGSFERLGIRAPKGVLLVGPPGCGKTLLARAVATETNANFIHVNGPEIFSKWLGESERAVRRLFKKAKEVSPSVLFFDEIDSITGSRGGDGSRARVVEQLMAEMDGVQPAYQVVVMAATNRPDLLDRGLLRPGRLDRVLFVPFPDEEERKSIFEVHTKKMPLAGDVSISGLVSRTEGYSGADVSAVCMEAGLFAMREDLEAEKISARHFEKALERVKPSLDDGARAAWAETGKEYSAFTH